MTAVETPTRPEVETPNTRHQDVPNPWSVPGQAPKAPESPTTPPIVPDQPENIANSAPPQTNEDGELLYTEDTGACSCVDCGTGFDTPEQAAEHYESQHDDGGGG